MKKSERELVFNKYGGKCAYCGCELEKGWHVDHLLPIKRKQRVIQGHWRHRVTKQMVSSRFTEEEGGDFEYIAARFVPDGCEYPERFHIDNYMPACASCNINKHSLSLESFRQLVSGFIKHLTEINTQYKIAKRYGLVIETGKEVKFYFETI